MFLTTRKGQDMNLVSIFSDFLDTAGSPYSNTKAVRFSDDQMTASVDLPGYNKEDITISILSDTSLLVRCSNKSRGDTTVKLNTPSEILIEETKASYSNGVLELVFTNKDYKIKTIQVT